MVIKAKWQKGGAWKGIGEHFCSCRVMGYLRVDNFRASCLPLAAYMANGLGKLRGKKSNLTSRNSSVSMRTPACVQLIKMQSQINVRRSRVWRVANVRACVWLCFHADRGKISPGMCLHAQSDDWSCEVRVELWQRRCQCCGTRDLWAHPSPTAPFLWKGGGLLSSIISSFSPLLS